MKFIRWLGCLVIAVALCDQANARPPKYKSCVEKPEFDRAEIIRDADKTSIEKPHIDKPQFDRPQFDRMKKEGSQFQRFTYEQNQFEYPNYDTRCDIKKKVVVRQPKKDTRYIPLQQRPYVPLEKRLPVAKPSPLVEAPKKATDCDCTAAAAAPSVHIH